MDQVQASILLDRMSLKVAVKLPHTFLSHARTAVRAADACNLTAGIATTNVAGINAVINRSKGLARVQAHCDCLIDYKKKTKGMVEMEIPLPCKVDQLFCRRDDYGLETVNARGLTVATYQHEDPVLNASGQLVFVLHVEMTASDHGETEMQSPSDLKTFHNFA